MFDGLLRPLALGASLLSLCALAACGSSPECSGDSCGEVPTGNDDNNDGDGHTAYGRSNTCVDSAIDAYYVQGRVPKDGLRC